MASTLLTAGDGTNGVVVTSGNDNTLTIQTGAAGAKVNALSFASDGTPTFLKGPTASMVRVNTANGYGSTNTKIRRFTNVVTNQGSDITYTDSATLGASFTINTNGVYAVSYSDVLTAAADQVGISLNTTTPTTNIALCAAGEVLSLAYVGGVNYAAAAAWVGYLPSGSVVRAHTNAGVNAGIPCQFTITRVA